MPIPEWLDPRKIATPQNLKQRIFTGINPLKTAIPTSRPGRLLKQANPLNPRNLAERIATEAARAALTPYLGKETTDELVTRAGFTQWDPTWAPLVIFCTGDLQRVQCSTLTEH